MWAAADIDSAPGQVRGGLIAAQATGVLVLALRVPPHVANRALAAAAHRHGVAVEALAAAVVARAGGLAGGDSLLSRTVRKEWGDLLD